MNFLDKLALKRITKKVERGISFSNSKGEISFQEWAKNLKLTSNTPIQEVIYQTVAREFAKVDLFAYDQTPDGKFEYSSPGLLSLGQVIGTRPNPLLTAYDWKFIVAYQLNKYGNSLTRIIWKNKDSYEIDSLEPMDIERYKFGKGYQLKNGRILLKLLDKVKNEEIYEPYEDLIHVRVNPNAIFEGDKEQFDIVGQLVKIYDENLNAELNRLSDSGTIRGFLRVGSNALGSLDSTLLGEEEKIDKQDTISERLKKAKGGVGVLDAGEDWIELKTPFQTMDEKQVEQWLNQIFMFKGINSKVIDGTATDDEMEVFFNKSIRCIIEPFVEEMNYKCLSQNIRTRGRKIDFRKNPFEYISVTKAMDAAYKGLSIATQNEMRLLTLKFPPLEGGDVLNNNLNFSKENNTEKGGSDGGEDS